MLKKTIAYADFNGDQHTEDFYFNLTKAELVEMELASHDGTSETMADKIQKIVEANNGRAIMDTFNDILRISYGRRSEDGKRFIKKPEFFDDFRFGGAYDVLFMELVTDAGAASAFINGLVPQDLAREVAKEVAARGGNIPTSAAPVYSPVPESPVVAPTFVAPTTPPQENDPNSPQFFSRREVRENNGFTQ